MLYLPKICFRNSLALYAGIIKLSLNIFSKVLPFPFILRNFDCFPAYVYMVLKVKCFLATQNSHIVQSGKSDGCVCPYCIFCNINVMNLIRFCFSLSASLSALFLFLISPPFVTSVCLVDLFADQIPNLSLTQSFVSFTPSFLFFFSTWQRVNTQNTILSFVSNKEERNCGHFRRRID